MWAYGAWASLFARIITYGSVWYYIKWRKIELKQLQLPSEEMVARASQRTAKQEGCLRGGYLLVSDHNEMVQEGGQMLGKRTVSIPQAERMLKEHYSHS